jgi:hypothetical protein
MLRYADIGVIGAAMVERSIEEVELSLGGRRRSRRRRTAADLDSQPADAGSADDGPPKKFARLELVHQAETKGYGEPIPWQWESSGTQTWLHLSRLAASSLRNGTVISIDDLGCDLHPLLTSQLVGLFQDPLTNPRGAQLIFTGHDTNLLGRHVEHRLHRDQIWLTSKGVDGATRLYPLTEYGRVRDGLDDVEGRYLQGRYGAVPFFDRSLIEELIADSAGSRDAR